MAAEPTQSGTTIYKKLKYDNVECVVEVAIKDGKGNNIVNTYATKTDVSNTYATKTYVDGTFATKDELSTETSRATAKETSLENSIKSEATARSNGDSSTLTSANTYTDTKVSAEQSARESADNTLQTNITAERTYADGTFVTFTKNETISGAKTFSKKITADDGLIAYKDTNVSTDYSLGKITNKTGGVGYELTLPTKTGTLALKSDIEASSSELVDYVDESVNKEAELRKTGDADTLTSAQSYTDTKLKDYPTKTDVSGTYATKTEVALKMDKSDFNADNIVVTLGNKPVKRADADGSGNSIINTYATKSSLTAEETARKTADTTLQANITAERTYVDATFVKNSGDETIYGVKTFDEAIKVGNTSYGESAISDGTYAFTLPTKDGVIALNSDVSSALATAESYTDGEIKKVNATISTLDSAKVNKSGDTMTGALNVPAINSISTATAVSIATGSNASSYFQARKFRGEGDGATYYHAVDFGYSGHNQVDFYEYAGVYNFWRNMSSTATTSNSDRVLSLSLGQIKERANTLTFPNKSGTFALTSDVSACLTSSKTYTDEKVASIDFSNYVTLDGAQTISGVKTFSSGVSVSDGTTATIYNAGNITKGELVFTLPSATGTLALTSNVDNALNSAKIYTNSKVASEATARETGDTNTLKDAKAYVDEKIGDIDFSDFASLSKGNTFTGNQIINGDLTVNGTFTKVDAETISTKEYTIGLAKGNTTAIASYVGLYAVKYDGTNDGALVWDNTGTAYVGDCSVDEDGKVTNVSMQPIMTRADTSSLASNGLLMWDSTNLKAVKATDASGNAITQQTIRDIISKNASQDTAISGKVSKSGDTMTGQLIVPSIKTSKALDANGTEWMNLGTNGYEMGDSGVNMQFYGKATRPTYNGSDLLLASDNKITATNVTINW